MKNLNKKGFILVETLIVTVFVVTMFILLYQATVPVLGDFEQYNRFEDINIIYEANLYKQMLMHYGNFDYIDKKIENDLYIEIDDCQDKNIYKSSTYCTLVKEAINLTENDALILTDYDITDFSDEVDYDSKFDSGKKYSNFRSYVNSLSKTDSFYANSDGKIGKYRLFLIKNVINSDGSKSRKYTNLGIFDGDKTTYVVGEEVYVEINNTKEKFYVLKNSDSTDSDITLIYSKNIDGSDISFSTEPTTNSLYDILSKNTKNWPSNTLTNYRYFSKIDGYIFNYENLKARLLDEYDIYELLKCKDYGSQCFDTDNTFDVSFDENDLSFLTDNLSDGEGYWTAITVPNTENAWIIENGALKAIPFDTPNIGVRPVITIDKSLVERGEGND